MFFHGGTATKYFLLGRDAYQVNPISAFLFILALGILFHLIKSKPGVKWLAIFHHCYLYSAYADDTTFFLQDTNSIKHMVDPFFSYFYGLKHNLKTSETVSIGVLKKVHVAVCDMRSKI